MARRPATSPTQPLAVEGLGAVEPDAEPTMTAVQLPYDVVERHLSDVLPVVVVDVGQHVGELFDLDQLDVLKLLQRPDQESPRRPLIHRMVPVGEQGHQPRRVAQRDVVEAAGDLQRAICFLGADRVVQIRERRHERMFA